MCWLLALLSDEKLLSRHVRWYKWYDICTNRNTTCVVSGPEHRINFNSSQYMCSLLIKCIILIKNDAVSLVGYWISSRYLLVLIPWEGFLRKLWMGVHLVSVWVLFCRHRRRRRHHGRRNNYKNTQKIIMWKYTTESQIWILMCHKYKPLLFTFGSPCVWQSAQLTNSDSHQFVWLYCGYLISWKSLTHRQNGDPVETGLKMPTLVTCVLPVVLHQSFVSLWVTPIPRARWGIYGDSTLI